MVLQATCSSNQYGPKVRRIIQELPRGRARSYDPFLDSFKENKAFSTCARCEVQTEAVMVPTESRNIEVQVAQTRA